MFEPRGEKSQWQVIYDRISQMEIGDVVIHQELASLLPDASKDSVRGATYRAIEVLQVERKRTLANVRNVGYRMIEANGHEDQAKKRQKRAFRQVKKGVAVAVAADRSLLTPDERRRIDDLEFHQRRHADMLRHLNERQGKLEARTAVTEKDSANLADQLDAVKKKLLRHGIE